MVTQSNYR